MVKKLFLGAYYRPHFDDQHSNDALNLSLQQLNETAADAKVWVVCEINQTDTKTYLTFSF